MSIKRTWLPTREKLIPIINDKIDCFCISKPGFKEKYAFLIGDLSCFDYGIQSAKEKDYIAIQNGTAHFLEHVIANHLMEIFKTKYANDYTLNAFTTFNYIGFSLSTIDDFYTKLEDFLKITGIEKLFRQDMIEHERHIILNEKRQIGYEIQKILNQNLLKGLYGGSSLETELIGTEEYLLSIDADIINKIYRALFNADKLMLILVGDIDINVIKEKLDNIEYHPGDYCLLKDTTAPDHSMVKNITAEYGIENSIFSIGFKHKKSGAQFTFNDKIYAWITTELILGKGSLFDNELNIRKLMLSPVFIENRTCKYFSYSSILGVSDNIDAVYDILKENIQKTESQKDIESRIEAIKDKIITDYIVKIDNLYNLGRETIEALMCDGDYTDLVNVVNKINYKDILSNAKNYLDMTNSSIAIIKGKSD